MTPGFILGWLAAVACQTEKVEIVSAGGVAAEAFFDAAVPDGSIGVLVGGPQAASEAWPDLLSAGGWTVVTPSSTVSRRVGGTSLTFLAAGQSADALRRATEAVRRPGIVVMVAAMPREEAAALLRNVPGIDVCIVCAPGGGDPAALKIGSAWLVEAPWGGTHWGESTLQVGPDGEVASVQHRVVRPVGASSKVAAAKKKHGLARFPVEVAAGHESGPAARVQAAWIAGNRACRFQVHNLRMATEYGVVRAGPGSALLVIDAELENIIPMSLVRDLEVPTEYRAANLSDHVYVVVNGDRLARLVAEADQLPGHLRVVRFGLNRKGDRARGNLVFALPTVEAVRSLELRFYDYAHGHFTIALQGEPPPAAAPVGAFQSNQVLEAGIFAVAKPASLDRRTAADGKQFVVVELRARSCVTLTADATAFDPQAAKGNVLSIGTFADWQDAPSHVHVLLDGEVALAPIRNEFSRVPRFLPDVWTGGWTAFEVDARARSLELVVECPNARLSSGETVRPRPLRFALEGTPTKLEDLPSIARIEDGPFRLTVVRIDGGVAEVAGELPRPGEKFLRVEFAVENRGTDREVFQAEKQLRIATEAGRQVALDSLSARLARPPMEKLPIPPGERRRFDAIYRIPRSETRPRMAYAGVTKADVLPLGELTKSSQCPGCSAEQEESARFCAQCGRKLRE